MFCELNQCDLSPGWPLAQVVLVLMFCTNWFVSFLSLVQVQELQIYSDDILYFPLTL